MENTVSDNTIGLMSPSVIVGEVVAGEAAAILKQIKSLVKNLSTNTFDLFELLHKAKIKKYYQPKFNTFAEYVDSLDLKASKAYYGVKMVEVMEQCGIPRSIYEPVGLSKLRIITRVKVEDEGKDTLFNGVPVKIIVKDLIEQHEKWTPEQLELKIKEVQGLVGDNASAGWINFPVTYAQKAAWEKAVSLAMLQIGSVAKDENTGKYKDASLGSCAEVIAVSFILDPNNAPEDEMEKDADSEDSEVSPEQITLYQGDVPTVLQSYLRSAGGEVHNLRFPHDPGIESGRESRLHRP